MKNTKRTGREQEEKERSKENMKTVYDGFTGKAREEKEVFILGNSEEVARQIARERKSIQKAGAKVKQVYMEQREEENFSEVIRKEQVARLQEYQKSNPLERENMQEYIQEVSCNMMQKVVKPARERKVYINKGEVVKKPKTKLIEKYITEVMNDLQYMQGLEKIALHVWVSAGTTDRKKIAIGTSKEYTAWRPFSKEDKQDIYYTSLENIFVEKLSKTVLKLHFLLGGNPKKEDFRRMFASFVKSSIRYQEVVFASKATGIPFYGEIKDNIKQERQISNLQDYTVDINLRRIDRYDLLEKHFKALSMQGLQGKKKALQIYNVYKYLEEGYDKVELPTLCKVSHMQIYRIIKELAKILK